MARGKRAAMRDHVEEEEDYDEEQGGANGAADGERGADGEADGDEDGEEDEDGEQSPKGRKRARANTVGDSHPSQNVPKLEKRTLPRDVDGYVFVL